MAGFNATAGVRAPGESEDINEGTPIRERGEARMRTAMQNQEVKPQQPEQLGHGLRRRIETGFKTGTRRPEAQSNNPSKVTTTKPSGSASGTRPEGAGAVA